MLSEKIDDLYATILRQSFFTIFEVDAHTQIANGTTVDEISKTYLQNLKEQFGNSVIVSEDFSSRMELHSSFLSYTILLLCIFFWESFSIIAFSKIQERRKRICSSIHSNS